MKDEETTLLKYTKISDDLSRRRRCGIPKKKKKKKKEEELVFVIYNSMLDDRTTSDTTYWMLCETVMQPAVRKLVVFARLDSSWPVLLYCPEYKQEHSGQQDEEIFIGLPTSLQTETHRNVPIETNEGTHTDLFDYLEGSQWNKEKPPVTSGSWVTRLDFVINTYTHKYSMANTVP